MSVWACRRLERHAWHTNGSTGSPWHCAF